MISGVIPQLRTTNLAESIRFYTTKVGLALEFQYEDFYEKDPSISFVDAGEQDDQGHTLYFSERRS